MKPYTYAMLVLNIFLWLLHWQMGFWHAAFCHNGKILCSLFVIRVTCELTGLVSSVMILHRVHKLWAAVLLSIFALLLSMDIVLRKYSSNREDDDSPKAMIIFPGGFTIEVVEISHNEIRN